MISRLIDTIKYRLGYRYNEVTGIHLVKDNGGSICRILSSDGKPSFELEGRLIDLENYRDLMNYRRIARGR